jgi:hypothetical protein
VVLNGWYLDIEYKMLEIVGNAIADDDTVWTTTPSRTYTSS